MNPYNWYTFDAMIQIKIPVKIKHKIKLHTLAPLELASELDSLTLPVEC